LRFRLATPPHTAADGPVAGMDVNNPEHSEKILSIMHDNHRDTREYWALWTGQFLAIARDGDCSKWRPVG
jgi:hypothetical protein